jgi:hypothetical protein
MIVTVPEGFSARRIRLSSVRFVVEEVAHIAEQHQVERSDGVHCEHVAGEESESMRNARVGDRPTGHGQHLVEVERCDLAGRNPGSCA